MPDYMRGLELTEMNGCTSLHAVCISSLKNKKSAVSNAFASEITLSENAKSVFFFHITQSARLSPAKPR